eukprot:1988011-Rhodomonas_salina.1
MLSDLFIPSSKSAPKTAERVVRHRFVRVVILCRLNRSLFVTVILRGFVHVLRFWISRQAVLCTPGWARAPPATHVDERTAWSLVGTVEDVDVDCVLSIA